MSSQTELAAAKRQEKFKSKQYSLGIVDPTFAFSENYENSSHLFSTRRIYAKNFYVFLFIFFEIVEKLKKTFVRQSLVCIEDTHQVFTVISWLDSGISCTSFLKI